MSIRQTNNISEFQVPSESGDRSGDSAARARLSISGADDFKNALTALNAMTKDATKGIELTSLSLADTQPASSQPPGSDFVLPGMRRRDIPQSLLPAFDSTDAATVQTRTDVNNILGTVASASPADRDRVTRQALADLRTMGPAGAPFLVAALNSENFPVRELAQSALQSFGSNQRVMDSVSAAFLDPTSSEETRSRTRQILEQNVGHFAQGLTSDRRDVSDRAQRVLNGLGERATPGLFTAMDDPATPDNARAAIRHQISNISRAHTQDVNGRQLGLASDAQGRLRFVVEPTRQEPIASIDYSAQGIQTLNVGGETVLNRTAGGGFVVPGVNGQFNRASLMPVTANAISVELDGGIFSFLLLQPENLRPRFPPMPRQ